MQNITFDVFIDEVTVEKDCAGQDYTHNKYGSLRGHVITAREEILEEIKAELLSTERTYLDDELIIKDIEKRQSDDEEEAKFERKYPCKTPSIFAVLPL